MRILRSFSAGGFRARPRQRTDQPWAEPSPLSQNSRQQEINPSALVFLNSALATAYCLLQSAYWFRLVSNLAVEKLDLCFPQLGKL